MILLWMVVHMRLFKYFKSLLKNILLLFYISKMIIYVLLLLNLMLFLYIIIKHPKIFNFSEKETYSQYEYDEEDNTIILLDDKHSEKTRYLKWLLENKNNIETLRDNDINNLLRISNNIEIELTDDDIQKYSNITNNVVPINY
jgi:hypothetical protein